MAREATKIRFQLSRFQIEVHHHAISQSSEESRKRLAHLSNKSLIVKIDREG